MPGPWLLAVILGSSCVALAMASAESDMRLPISDSRWEKKVFPPAGVATDEAAVLAIERDANRGPCLVVGPWRRGRYSTRFQYAEPLPFTTGVLRGYYRTEDLPIYGATVYIEFRAGKRRIATKYLGLAPAEDWTPFEFAFRSAPTGADSVSPGLGLAGKTEGKALFTGLTMSPRAPELELPADPGPVTRPAPPDRCQKTGFYHLEERGGVWWLITPEGEGFYSIGTDGPWLFRETDWMTRGREAAAFLRSAGFNSLAGWTKIRRWGPINDALAAGGEKPFAIFATLETGSWSGRCDALVDAGNDTTGEGHAFPDPFDPRFEEVYRGRVREIANIVRGKSWFIGYFADNEVCHTELYRHVYSEHCSHAFRGFLESRYSDIAAVNEAWGTGFASLDALIAGRPEPTKRTGRMYDDFTAFEREIVTRYIDITLRVIREEDPDHLVISNRFMLDDIGAWMDHLDLYSRYDAIAVNLYPANQRAGLSDVEKLIYRTVHEKTGRPIIVGEWSIPALDSGLYDNPEKLDWSWNEAVGNQSERARQAARVTLGFYNMPFVVGAHWFIWSDIDEERRQANRGLVRAGGQPWDDLVEALTRAHARIGAAQAR